MKRVFLLCLALGTLPAFGEETRQAPVAPPVSLYTQFEQAPPPAIMNALQDELQTIMEPIGMSFDWRSLKLAKPNEVSVELAVVTFKGHCDLTNMLPIRTYPGALGWTHVSDGAILPFSDVDCDRIRGFVQRELLAMPPEKRETAFGRAVARVLAHELYHIFAATSKHGSCGVAKSAYTVQELLAGEFQFEEKESDALRTSKAHAQLENAAGTM